MKKIFIIALVLLMMPMLSVSAVAYNGGFTTRSGEFDFETLVIWAVIIALAVSSIVVGIIIKKYKTKLKAPIYPLSNFARLKLIGERDTFTGKFVTRVRVRSNNRKR